MLTAAIAVAVVVASRSRLARLQRAARQWLQDDDVTAADIPDTAEPSWRALEEQISALGAAYVQRGDRLRRERPWRRQLVDAITLPALLFDGDGHLVVANEAAGLTFGAMDGVHLTVLQALGSTALADAVNLARQSERPVELEAQLADDREVYGVASPVGDETLLIVSDRTAQRRLGEVRRDFVANASHELKSPVAGIQALIEALQVTVDRDPMRARDLIERLSDEAERLSKLVHDLLDLRRLETRDGGEVTTVDLVAIVRDRVDHVRAMAEAQEVAIELDLPGQAVVAAIEEDLRLAVGNLLDNAVRYNERGGGVSVSLERSGAAYLLRITDTGVGIPKQDLDRVFERFYRVDIARSRATGGTGLGLALVRHAIERQGGGVAVASLLGEGSSFTLTIPIESRTRARGPRRSGAA